MSAGVPKKAQSAGQQQQAKGADSPAPIVQQPSSANGQQAHACPGTNQSQYDCNTVSAIANVRQAVAAEWFNHLAYVEIGVGLVTAVVAYFAAKFASGAVKAARENLAQDKRTARAQLRPWICFQAFDVTRFTNLRVQESGEVVKNGLMAAVRFINTGSTPALKVRIYADYRMCGLKDEFAPHFERPAHTRQSEGALGPQRSVDTADRYMGPDDSKEIMAQRKGFWLYARADYEEPGHEGEPYRTEITMKVWYGGTGMSQTGPEKMIWQARTSGTQTTMT